MTTKFNRGFTLIELLVVIAIIGILSSVVLASLNTARGKGANSAIKSNLANARTQAELYYNSMNDTYSAVCGLVNAPDGTKTINGFVLTAHNQSNATTFSTLSTTAGSLTTSVCHSATGAPWAWAAAVPLKVPEGLNRYWCVDSTGFSGGRINIIPGSGGAPQYVCPSS